jgi:hypothetical protein
VAGVRCAYKRAATLVLCHLPILPQSAPQRSDKEFDMGIAIWAAVRMAQAVPMWLDGIQARRLGRSGKRPCAQAPRAMAHASAAPVVRVVRVVEPHQPRSAAGRMVISGRMADVCAELDRLAAAEASH